MPDRYTSDRAECQNSYFTFDKLIQVDLLLVPYFMQIKQFSARKQAISISSNVKIELYVDGLPTWLRLQWTKTLSRSYDIAFSFHQNTRLPVGNEWETKLAVCNLHLGENYAVSKTSEMTVRVVCLSLQQYSPQPCTFVMPSELGCKFCLGYQRAPGSSIWVRITCIINNTYFLQCVFANMHYW